MKATFIGENGSMGLKNGKIYNLIAIKSAAYPIALQVQEQKQKSFVCPYNSFESLFKNWEFKEGLK